MKKYLCRYVYEQYFVVKGINKRDAQINVLDYLVTDWDEAIVREYEPRIRIVCRVIK